MMWIYLSKRRERCTHEKAASSPSLPHAHLHGVFGHSRLPLSARQRLCVAGVCPEHRRNHRHGGRQDHHFLPSRLFGQRLVLEAEQRQRLAVFQTRLYMTDWSEANSLRLPLVGLNLDKVWENIVSQIAGIEMEQGRSLDDQLVVAAQREKLQREIARLEKQARAERQPKKKFELVQKLNKLRIEEQQI